jgi:hypothetical protein
MPPVNIHHQIGQVKTLLLRYSKDLLLVSDEIICIREGHNLSKSWLFEKMTVNHHKHMRVIV